MEYLTAFMIVAVGLAQDPAGDEPERPPEAESLREAEVAPAEDVLEEPELAPLLEPITAVPPPQPEPEPASEIWAKYPAGTVLYVDASSLGLRTGPKRDAILVHYMPRETRVVTMEDVIDSVPDTIGSRKGHWIFVRHGQHEGYVFDAYLAPMAPSMHENIDWLCEPGTRVGPITSKTTLEELMAFFGESNVRDAVIPVGEGETVRGTVVFPEDPQRRQFIKLKNHKD